MDMVTKNMTASGTSQLPHETLSAPSWYTTAIVLPITKMDSKIKMKNKDGIKFGLVLDLILTCFNCKTACFTVGIVPNALSRKGNTLWACVGFTQKSR